MNPVFNTQEVLAYAYAIQNKNNGYMKDTQRFSETNNKTIFSNKDYLKLNKKYSEKKTIEYFIFNKLNSSSIFNSLNISQQNSLVIRDVLPEQSIIKLNDLIIKFNKNIKTTKNKNNYVKLLNGIIQGSQNFMYSTDRPATS